MVEGVGARPENPGVSPSRQELTVIGSQLAALWIVQVSNLGGSIGSSCEES